MKYEAKKIMSIYYLETLNIEWGQIDPKGNRRVNTFAQLRIILAPRTVTFRYRILEDSLETNLKLRTPPSRGLSVELEEGVGVYVS